MGMVKFYFNRACKYMISHGFMVSNIYLILSDLMLMKIYLDIISIYDKVYVFVIYFAILLLNSWLSKLFNDKLDDCYKDNEESLQ